MNTRKTLAKLQNENFKNWFGDDESSDDSPQYTS